MAAKLFAIMFLAYYLYKLGQRKSLVYTLTEYILEDERIKTVEGLLFYAKNDYLLVCAICLAKIVIGIAELAYVIFLFERINPCVCFLYFVVAVLSFLNEGKSREEKDNKIEQLKEEIRKNKRKEVIKFKKTTYLFACIFFLYAIVALNI
jgi:hypothetical protein